MNLLKRSTVWTALVYPILAAAAVAQDNWSPITSAGPTQGSNLASAVWTGEEMLVWGGNLATGNTTNLGLRYNPRTDVWSVASSTSSPSARYRHSAVWTGRELIVWGGAIDHSGNYTNTGGRYDPRTDTWTATSTTGAPSARHSHTAVWTGKEMIVFGGIAPTTGAYLSTGARYDPASDTWSPMSATSEPTARAYHGAVWTGRQMLIWGGTPQVSVGGGYDPLTDAWTPITTVGAPVSRSQPYMAWTGRELVVWGGDTGLAGPYVNTGGRYDPVSDSWSPTSMVGVPTGRIDGTSVWTGRELIVWGGQTVNNLILDDGARYDPERDTWTVLPSFAQPAARFLHVAAWTGLEMIIFGGADGATTNGLVNGSSYRPPISPSDQWGTISLTGAPEARSTHAAVWTGRDMIVWGGHGLISNPGLGYRLNTGGRYDFTTGTWVATDTTGAPNPRSEVQAVWTGREMIVWGKDTAVVAGPGGRYDPVSDTWVLMSQTGEPSPRYNHTQIWTGKEVIVWGGSLVAGGPAGDGARYDPKTDTWAPVTPTGAPSARYYHSAVWTGREMIIWGGLNSLGIGLDTGASYDPRTDTWTSLTLTNAPPPRGRQTAVWTGSEMLVWGGAGYVGTGGRYAPKTDTWASLPTLNAPTGRHVHSAVWTGSEMIVWGGQDSGGRCQTGARYSPSDNLWSATTLSAAPVARTDQTGVWTDRYLAIWGGNDGGVGAGHTNTGGYYGFDPFSSINTLTAVETCTARVHAPESSVTVLCLGLVLVFLAFRKPTR